MSYLSNIHPQTGKKILFDYSDYAKTGNKAVDTIAQIVGYYRKLLLDNKKKNVAFYSLKAIYLRQSMYDKFLQFTIKKAGELQTYELLAGGREITFDDVDIMPEKKAFWKEKNTSYKCTFYPSINDDAQYEESLIKLGLKKEEDGLAKYY